VREIAGPVSPEKCSRLLKFVEGKCIMRTRTNLTSGIVASMDTNRGMTLDEFWASIPDTFVAKIDVVPVEVAKVVIDLPDIGEEILTAASSGTCHGNLDDIRDFVIRKRRALCLS